MATLTLNIHLPLLRISEPNISFLGGTLWRMPFETFNGLTSGAFESHNGNYEQTNPVFFNYEINVEDAPWSNVTSQSDRVVMEIKVPTNEQNYNNEIIDTYPFSIFKFIHDQIIDRVWETLILGIPTGQFIQPRHSISFINADNDVQYFMIGDDHTTSMANFRGDADLEYLLMPEASGKEVDVQTIILASEGYSLLSAIQGNNELAEAFSAMKTSNLPYITSDEKYTICLAALENLVIPEIFENLRKTFAHRIAVMLSDSSTEYSRISDLSSSLYSKRSQIIHGNKKGVSNLPYTEAQLLLAQLIKTLAHKINKGEKLTEILAEADKSSQKTNGNFLFQATEIVNDSSFKLMKKEVSITASIIPGAVTASESLTTLLYWSPLFGLTTNIDSAISGFSASIITFLNTNDLISLEDKDIRRDFIAKFRMIECQTASICLPYHLQNDDPLMLVAGDEILTEFERIRNLIVVGLRLAGLKKFIDPELLGNFLYRSSMRYRQATVLRQSIFMELGKESTESLEEVDQELLMGYWNLLSDFHYKHHSIEIDLIFNLYRRIHESRYMPITSRAGLSFVLLEKLLGPFRNKNEKVQLEDLVTAVIGKSEVSDYFIKSGRKTRNSIAHGYWEPKSGENDFINVVQVLDRIIPAFLNINTNNFDDTSLKPKDVFINQILTSKM